MDSYCYTIVYVQFEHVGDKKRVFFFFFCLFVFFRAAPAAYGGTQARGGIGAVATVLRQSYRNSGSEPCLQPTPQLTTTWDPH